MAGVLLILVASATLAVLVKLCCTAADEVHERSSRTSRTFAKRRVSASTAAHRGEPDDDDLVSKLTLGELREALASAKRRAARREAFRLWRLRVSA